MHDARRNNSTHNKTRGHTYPSMISSGGWLASKEVAQMTCPPMVDVARSDIFLKKTVQYPSLILQRYFNLYIVPII